MSSKIKSEFQDNFLNDLFLQVLGYPFSRPQLLVYKLCDVELFGDPVPMPEKPSWASVSYSHISWKGYITRRNPFIWNESTVLHSWEHTKCTHTHRYKHMQYMYTHVHTFTHAHTCIKTNTHMCPHTNTYTDSHMNTNTHTHTCMHIHKYMHTFTRTWTHMQDIFPFTLHAFIWL